MKPRTSRTKHVETEEPAEVGYRRLIGATLAGMESALTLAIKHGNCVGLLPVEVATATGILTRVDEVSRIREWVRAKRRGLR